MNDINLQGMISIIGANDNQRVGGDGYSQRDTAEPPREDDTFQASGNEGPSEEEPRLIIEGLPPGFVFDGSRELILHVNSKGDFEDLCGPIHIIGRGSSRSGESAYIVVVFFDEDRNQKTLMIRRSDLVNSKPQCVTDLLDAGFYMPGPTRHFIKLLKGLKTKNRIESPTVPGWVDADFSRFGLPDGRAVCTIAVSQETPQVVRQFELDQTRLDGWNNSIAANLPGNNVLIFAILASLCGPLLGPLGLTTHGYNLVGKSSTGKTSAAKVGMSTWGEPKLGDWNASDPVLDDLCKQANGTALVLDEFPSTGSTDLARRIYKILNGTSRQVRKGSSQSYSTADIHTYSLIIISTSESSVSHVLSAKNNQLRSGHLVRLIDIRLPAGPQGLISNLHGFETSYSLIKHLERSAFTYSGILGPTFVKGLIAAISRGSEAIRKLHRICLNQICLRLGVDPRHGDGEVMRVLQYFAAVMTAGLIASTKKILALPKSDVENAVFEVALTWFEARGGLGGFEGARVLDALRNWLATASGAKLIWLDPEGRPQRMTAKAAGWQDAFYYYLLPETMLSLTNHTIEGNRIGRALADLGLLEPGVHPRSLQFRMGSGIPGRPYVYRILKARFEV